MARRRRKPARRKPAGARGNVAKPKKSPHIVAEGTMRINGKPAHYRVYRKSWKYPHLYVATIHVGKTEMYNKRPRLGLKTKKGKKSKKRRR